MWADASFSLSGAGCLLSCHSLGKAPRSAEPPLLLPPSDLGAVTLRLSVAGGQQPPKGV